ncbi:MAG TPA: hypothetical protein P5275_08330 [Saprospiraceae bacterium]|nr:hypothetical protein [Saprospiraceae bacterium]MCB9270352.1 hypothetical protein [Lewinellaceae bacterium]HPG08510.1 hypothetical protein [Saprospiraceae bacterium]HPQ98285.1 hypothetical protein [Saprospiraceae bacterium]HRV84852.1 hypothetical protein [Saprospiraceae bacterium]
MSIPKVHRFDYDLVEELYRTLGKHTRLNRWKFQGINSSLLWYGGGHPFLDRLVERSHKELRISFELLRFGFIVWINEHSTTYLMPLPFDAIGSIEIHYEPASVRPESGTLFQWLINLGVRPDRIARFARPHEYEEDMAHVHVIMKDMALLFWTNGRSFDEISTYFNKPLCSLMLPVKVFSGE